MFASHRRTGSELRDQHRLPVKDAGFNAIESLIEVGVAVTTVAEDRVVLPERIAIENNHGIRFFCRIG